MSSTATVHDPDPVAAWVRRLNRLAAEIDAAAAAIHPSARLEALAPLHERYIRIARQGPVPQRRRQSQRRQRA
jgi:hypothetical protein